MSSGLQWRNEEVAKSMFFLVKSNNGFFRSAKQRDFLRDSKGGAMPFYRWPGSPEKSSRPFQNENDRLFFCENFGIEVEPSDVAVMVDGYIRWVNYGSKSLRRVEYVFILDEFGCKAKYKLGFEYNKGASAVDASKTECVWKRDESIELPVFEEVIKVELPKSEFVGFEGERLSFKGKVVSCHSAGFSRFGEMIITKILVNGKDELVYFGVIENLEFRGEVEFSARIKSHQVYREKKQTRISHVTKVKVLSSESVEMVA